MYKSVKSFPKSIHATLDMIGIYVCKFSGGELQIYKIYKKLKCTRL